MHKHLLIYCHLSKTSTAILQFQSIQNQIRNSLTKTALEPFLLPHYFSKLPAIPKQAVWLQSSENLSVQEE